MAAFIGTQFPCSLTLDVPFPDARLASVALRALQVDQELSPLVQRALSTVTANDASGAAADGGETVLRVRYSATTNRMLRVSVNSFLESLALVLEVMEALDVDVIESKKA
ncbi:transcription factor Pcc1 [Thozetella sp. PMI_491]|nr:transcription factor Pcc1 [Thozetella sp. PMI_491]